MLLSLLKFLIHIFCKAVFFVKTVGKENLPQEGAVILAINHTSLWDAPVLVSEIPRNMRIMAKKELFSNKLFASVLKLGGAFPVARGTADVGAIKTALKTLKDGDVFAIFPSGTRVKSDEAADAKAGVALIASRSGAPVIPIALRGGYKPFHRVTMHIGKPMEFPKAEGTKPTGDDIKAFADEIMKKIESLGV